MTGRLPSRHSFFDQLWLGLFTGCGCYFELLQLFLYSHRWCFSSHGWNFWPVAPPFWQVMVVLFTSYDWYYGQSWPVFGQSWLVFFLSLLLFGQSWLVFDLARQLSLAVVSAFVLPINQSMLFCFLISWWLTVMAAKWLVLQRPGRQETRPS